MKNLKLLKEDLNTDKLYNYNKTLCQYKGGGYDGCYWEWNYFYFDSKGVFHNLLSTGYKGMKDETQSREYLLEEEGYTYQLDKQEDLDEFIMEAPESHAIAVGKLINEIENEQLISPKCSECSNERGPEDLYYTGYHGNGGIGVVLTDYVCSDCYCSGLCDNCDYVGSDNLIFSDKDEVLCKHCYEEN